MRVRPLVLSLSLVLAGCVDVNLQRRARADLGCNEEISIRDGYAGAVTASGCGQSIEYVCSGARGGESCIEQHRYADPAVPRTSATGSDSAACFGNATCDEGLVCIQSICVKPGGPRQLGGACEAGKCEFGLACVATRCEPAPDIPTGASGGACYANQTCNSGLACKHNGTCGAEAPR